MWGAYASFIESNQEKETNKPVITPTMETVNRFRETIILSYNFNTVGGHKHCPGKTMSGPQSPFFFCWGGGGGGIGGELGCKIQL